jgi:NAD(P)-dependent dehydrogenase (short-subunit alcohol dehydrogenase family)
MGLLKGDTALITGAASGVGQGIAKALVAEGVRPVLSDVAVEAGRALAREMNVTFIAADLADPTAIRIDVATRLSVRTKGRLSAVSLDALVNSSRAPDDDPTLTDRISL